MPRNEYTGEQYHARLRAVTDPMTLPAGQHVADWMRLHTRTIGGSSVGKILGLSSYGTASDVWDGFMNRAAPQERTSVLDRGHAMEPIIVEIYAAETGRIPVGDGRTRFEHPDHWWMHATPDREIHRTWAPQPYTSSGVLECKCLGSHTFRGTKENGIDPSYYAQLQHYLDVRGYEWGSFAVFNAEDWELYWFDVPRDNEFILEKNRRLIEFWEHHVLQKVRPQPIVRSVYVPPRVGAEHVERSSTEWVAKMRELKQWHEQKKLAEHAYERIRDEVKLLMDSEGVSKVTVPGVGKVTLSNGTRRSFNKDLFRQEHPEINLSDYEDVSESRALTPRFE